MCYVIVTGRSLLWTLLSLVAFMAVFAALFTPKWIVGPALAREAQDGLDLYAPTLGVFNRCIKMEGKIHCANFDIDGFATDSFIYPSSWKATYFFMTLGLVVMFITILAAVVGFCFQSIGRKSIFNLAGVAQAIAGIFYLFGMILYPAGWGHRRVQRICGSESSAFNLSNCSLGWAFYSAVLGIALTFVCAVLSGQAEKSTASDKVQDQMNEGKTLICLV